jgi:hypothetical protein
MPENVVIKELEQIIHEAKHPRDEIRLEQLDAAYQRKLRMLSSYGMSGTFERFSGYYNRWFPHQAVAR